MHLSRVYSAELEGINARIIEIEVDLHVGLHSFTIVGLADKALNEARERVSSALKNSGAKPPNRENRKITVNLAPADVKKTGSQYDLAIAIGYLLATDQLKALPANDTLFAGELSLDGRLRPIFGALNIAQAARDAGFKTLYLPALNAEEANIVEGLTIMPVGTLLEVLEVLEGRREITALPATPPRSPQFPGPDLSEIKGQENAKRALAIAAAGGHNLLMIGPPGVGKSLLAKAMMGILPSLSIPEAIEITKIHSVAGTSAGRLVSERPFRSPHQTASAVAIIGGGSDPKPGEISLAHRGVLFLDELPEFQKNVLESLRQPIESGVVHVSRAKGTVAFPAQFTLVAAMNPCPCGYFGDAEKECRCGAYDVLRYQKRISGPLLDRIDLRIRVPRVALQELRTARTKPETPELRVRVERARKIQKGRFKGLGIHTNAEMSSNQTEKLVRFGGGAEQFLQKLDKTRLSPRGYYRLLKTAQTIADLEESPTVRTEHLAEAFSYRLREEV